MLTKYTLLFLFCFLVCFVVVFALTPHVIIIFFQRVSSLNATVFDGPQLRKLTEGISALLEIMCDVVDSAEVGGVESMFIKHQLESLVGVESLQSKGQKYIDGLVQDCSISSALAMEILQYCTKLSICGRVVPLPRVFQTYI